MNNTTFHLALLGWYNRHKRDLPWRKFDDPYLIWISEVILQQTRVSQGLPYFLKFQKNYPSVYDLAEAPEEQLLKDWEGLGYYSRARNMHSAARQIVADFNGEFPVEHSEIRKLKGVGDYTAAAISSFAFGQPHAVVDGNVFRVLARVFGITTPINTGRGKNEFAKLAAELLYNDDPATYNQAIMEFGAMQCTPKNPDCESCPLQPGCFAYTHGRVGELPAKKKKKYDRQRYFNYVVLEHKEHILVEQRTAKDVWQKLYQFPMVEHPHLMKTDELLEEMHPRFAGHGKFTFRGVTDLKPHKLSHQTIHCRMFEISLMSDMGGNESVNEKWVVASDLETLAFPRPLRVYLDRKQLTLPLDK